MPQADLEEIVDMVAVGHLLTRKERARIQKDARFVCTHNWWP